MVNVATSIDKDVAFLKKHRLLQEYIIKEKKLPTVKDNPTLYNFVAKQRLQYRKNPALNYWKWRIQLLHDIGIDVTSGARITKNPSPTNIEPSWRPTLNTIKAHSNNQKLQQDLQWFNAMLAIFQNRKGFLKQNRYNTLYELLIKWFQVGDIPAKHCTRNQPPYDFRHTLSYIVTPLSYHEYPPLLTPTWRLKDNRGSHDTPPQWKSPLQFGNTVYFDSTKFDPEIFKDTIRSLPTWIVQCYEGTFAPKGDSIVRLIEQDQKHFDHFPYLKGGTRWKDGITEITKTQLGRPRRLNLYDKIHGYTYDNRHKCSVQDGFSYTLSFIPPMFYGGRSLEDYHAIAQLKVDIWKRVYHWLSPLSKLCPPNGVQCLLYVADFNAEISPHRDMNPDMKVDPSINSQILGTSVIIVTLFDTQVIKFGRLQAKKFHEHDSFEAEHCSVYVLDPHDDTLYHHTNKFPTLHNHKSRRPTRIRCALTFRWLGNRRKFFGPDNKAGLQHCQVQKEPYKFLEKKWPNSQETRQAWERAIKQKRADNKKKQQEQFIPK